LTKVGWTFAASFAFEFLAVLLALTALLLAGNVKAPNVGSGGGR